MQECVVIKYVEDGEEWDLELWPGTYALLKVRVERMKHKKVKKVMMGMRYSETAAEAIISHFKSEA